MNLEHLCQSIRQNYHRLKDEKKALSFLRYHFELLAWKRQKLKLGAIVFEIKKIIIAGITLHESIEIRYIRQDTTKDDEIKIENRLKALGWKWDFKNIGAFIVVLLLGITFVYAQIYLWYCEHLPTLAYRDPCIDEMIKFSFRNVMTSHILKIFKYLIFLNEILADSLSKFCIEFNIIL